MPSNIKIKSLARSAGKAVDASGNPTSCVPGSEMAASFLTGDINQTVYRHLPDTIGSISGTSPRPVGDQYQFYEFDGKVPNILVTSISTISDNSNINVGKQVTIAFTTTGVTSTGYSVKLYVANNSDRNNEILLATYTGYTGNLTNETIIFTNTYDGILYPNQTNYFRLLLTTNDVPYRYAEDITSIYIYPTDLIITAVALSPAFTGAGTHNYTTGSVFFSVTAVGGVSPYFYNFNGAGYGASGANTTTFSNASTTTADAFDIVVKDSASPTFDTATNTPTTFRPPIRVSIASINSSPEPYVDYTITSAISNNTDSVTITYDWTLSGTQPSTSTTANPTVYYSSLGSKTHRVAISQASNSSIRHDVSSTVTVAMISPSISATYTTGTETFAVSVTALTAGTSGTTLRYDIDYAVKDSGGSYGAWTSMVSNGTSITPTVSIAGKTANAQYAKARVRARRSDGTTEYLSGYTETGEVLIAQKGIITLADQTDLLTGANRTFDGSVAIGGTADTSFSVFSVTAVTTNSSVSASGARPSSNILRITVNNPATSVNDGTASHVVTVTDGNGYSITKSFTTQYKINATQIALAASWNNNQYYNSASNSLSFSLSGTFTYSSFQYKVETGGTYTNINSGTYTSSHSYTAPSADQTWYYHVKASGGTYTQSDFSETSVTVYGYAGQGYGYSLSAVPSSGTLSQVQSVVARISRSSGNFTKISATYTVTKPSDADVSPASLSDASISDTAVSFDSAAFSLYNVNDCGATITGTAYVEATLTYNISASLRYYHQLTTVSVSIDREAGMISTDTGSLIGINAYAVRAVNFQLYATFTSYGPPFTSAGVGGYWYAYVGVGTMSYGNIQIPGNEGDSFDDINYFRTKTASTYCRKIFPMVTYTRQEATRGTYSYTFNAFEYTVSGTPGNYTLTRNANGSVASTAQVIIVKGRRLDTIGGTITAVTDPGSTLISYIDGTWKSNLSGPDGGVTLGDTDGTTYKYQRSTSLNGTYTDISGDLYDPGTFGTTYIRVVVTDDWGTETIKAGTAFTTRDFDYSMRLTDTNNRADIYYPGAFSGKYLEINQYTAFSFSATDIAAVTLPVYSGYASYFQLIDLLDDSSLASFSGAYLTVTQTHGSVAMSRVKLVNSPLTYGGLNEYHWEGNGDTDAYTDIKNSSSQAPTTLANGVIAFWFTTVPEYNTEVLITVTGQKSSASTTGQVKYYFRYRTAAAVNAVTFTSETGQCGGILVSYTTGTIQTAYRLTVQESTDNSTFTDTAYTYTSIAASTLYNAFITIDNTTKYYRVRLLDSSGNVLTTSTSRSFTSVTAGTLGSISSDIYDSPTCDYIRWTATRPAGGTASTNASYWIEWYVCSGINYGTQTVQVQGQSCNYGTQYTGYIGDLACESKIAFSAYAVSSTGCTGTQVDTDCLVYKYAQRPCTCEAQNCLVYGTKVLMYDDSEKLVEDLEEGDLLKNYDIDGLSDEEKAWLDFETNDFKYSESMSSIKTLIKDVYYYYYDINDGELKITYEHPVFCKIDDISKFVKTEDLQIGYKMFDINKGWIDITSIERVDELTPVVSIDVTANNTYFANNLLIHNAAPKQ